MTLSADPTRRLRWFEHALVLLAVCMSGNPLFTMGSPITEGMFITAALGMAFLLLLRVRGRMLHDDFVIVLAGLCTILLLQSVVFSFLPIVTIMGFLLRLFIAYAILRMVRDFGRTYVNVMTMVGVMSLCFYIPDALGRLGGFHLRSHLRPIMLLSLQRYFDIGVHNFGDIDFESYRNSGFFWEPGAFAGFLLLAMVFLALRRGTFTRRGYNWRLGIMTFCLLTTMSTMGYVIMPLVLFMNFWPSIRSAKTLTQQIVPFFGIIILTGGILVGFYNLTFMQGKIARQMEKVVGKDAGWEMTRFGSLVFDMQYIEKHPILGWGLNSFTRFQMHPGSTLGSKHGNGLSDFLTKFGAAGLILFFAMVARGIYNLSGRSLGHTAMVILVMLMILQGETFLGGPLFLGMMFLGVHTDRPQPRPRLALLRVRA